MKDDNQRRLEAQIRALTKRYRIQPSYALEAKIKRLYADLAAVKASNTWNEFLAS